MKEIPLTRGYKALVDDEDYERVAPFRWRVETRNKRYSHRYAKRNVTKDGKRTVEYMHRFLLNAPPELVVDHRDRDGLNNTRENLRTCTRSQNQWNRKPDGNRQLKGLWRNERGRFVAVITFQNRHIHLGMYATAQEAAGAYDAKAKELFGEFARLNFP